MNQLLAEVVRGFEFQFKQGGVMVEISDLPVCRGDQVQINQVFSNLLDNALKYLDPRRPGRIRISGGMANGRKDFHYISTAAHVTALSRKCDRVVDHQTDRGTARGKGVGGIPAGGGIGVLFSNSG